MAKLVECVPNFSEGCNKEVIEALGQAISRTPGCTLLDVDAGASTNRTVYTFVGTPEAVVEGALSAARMAWELIDMSQHKGEHPRIGALDVCPFVPVMNTSMEECVVCAHIFGQRLSEELGVPVYLYGEAARQESRRTLPAIRVGEYEALPKKLEKPEWAPDFGPPTFVPQWGATVTGARTFLIAYNINLLCTKELAHRIALNIREQGRGADQPGSLKKVQGIGWYLEEENIAQVSTNLLDFETTPLHAVYEEVCCNAEALKLPVVGSQLVGLIPKKAMLDAAEFYIKKEKLFILEEEHKIKLVVSRLGLDSLSPFNPRERIIEYLVQAGQEEKGLVAKPLGAFVRAVGGRSAAPGGGSVAATAASLGAALGCMVGLMSYGKRQFEQLDPIMRNVIPPLHQAMDELVAMVDADSRAFSSYMEAMKLPKSTPEEKERRAAAMQQGLKTAVEVPCTLAVKVNNLWSSLKMLAHHGNLACKSDLQVGAKMLEAAVFGAYFNVMINLKDITDEKFKTETLQMVTGLLEEAKQGSALVLALLEKREA
ncbi:formimidoyltransferase-cyclodeaminase isoform X1 [Lagopus leucura]|uniref:formimidoyltransferase-cyclodeaminase isoform X1 n=1 Tax=Lagopus leucura TaxID=30410 RepID=UPI001C681068|nr:formimidoyltransferase-cyclodeaminase isoform X1 [Lagopus leucura]